MLATYRGLRFAVLGLCAGICLGSEPVLLELRQPRDRQLSGGESHEYRFVLNAGQYARLLVDQRSVNVAVEICDPSGKSVYAADSYPAGDAEVLQFVAENSGIHRLRLFAPARTAPLGLYSITLDEIVPATDRHRHLAAGALAYAKAMASATEGSKASRASASKSFDEAITHWQAAQDFVAEARTLTTLGLHYGQTGERRKAIEFTGRALKVAKASENSQAEAWAWMTSRCKSAHSGGSTGAVISMGSPAASARVGCVAIYAAAAAVPARKERRLVRMAPQF